MIKYKRGDLFDSEAEAIVNTVNCVGVMGRGIALQFKKHFPENFKFYETACKQGKVIPGKVLTYDMEKLGKPRYIINFPTKRHWRDMSRIEDIKDGLSDLTNEILAKNISSIAIPPLGCGLGGLKWSEVKPYIEAISANLPDVYIEIFEPNTAPPAKLMAKDKQAPNMTPGRAALIALMQKYLDGLLDTSVTLLEIHKLMYFLQEYGEALRLKFVKAPYGPYAENLSHVLNRIEGHFLYGYADGGDKPDKQISIIPGVEQTAEQFLFKHAETNSRIQRVAKLVDGFETPFGIELLATVHWLFKYEGATENSIVEQTYAWGSGKQKFSHKQIEKAVDRLKDSEII